MIGEHLWAAGGGRWRAGERRRCLKCGAEVMLAKVPRNGSRVFCMMARDGKMTTGGMQSCDPPKTGRKTR